MTQMRDTMGLLREELDALAAREQTLRQALARAAYVTGNLMGMIDRETWRAQGGDDQQGHYEGDYWAEQTADEIRGWAALAADAQEENRG